MKVGLIRHGKTKGNLERRYIGRTDESLCPEGVASLKKGSYPEAGALLSSPMKRCLESAEIIYPGLAPRIEKDLRECDFGRFENKNYQELADDPAYKAWIDSGGRLPFPEGESQEDFRSRSVAAFCRQVDRWLGAGVEAGAILLHGGNIMAILDCLSDPHKDFYSWQVGNGSGYLLHIREKLWTAGDRRVEILRRLPYV